MSNVRVWALLALLVAGCQRAPGSPVTTSEPTRPEPQAHVSVSAPLPAAPSDPDVITQKADPDPQWGTLEDISRKGGLIGDLQGLMPEESEGYHSQLVPENTQDQAQELAHAWSSDARQLYVGWGFWKVSLLGKVRHVYYSARKNRVLYLEYNLTKGRLTRSECDGDKYKQAFLVLRDAYDIHAFTARDAYARARSAGYRPGKYSVCSLMHLLYFGPVWVFIEDSSWTPTVIVKAKSGEVVTEGPLMWAVNYLVKLSGKGDSPTPCTKAHSAR